MLIEEYCYLSYVENPIVEKYFYGNKKNTDEEWKRIECVTVFITGDEYEICEKTSHSWWASKKKTEYGKGLGNTKENPLAVERTGLLGQAALAKVCKLPLDITYRENGDKYDNVIAGYKVDIKCAMIDYGQMLICGRNDRGRYIPLSKDIYIASYIEFDNLKEKFASVTLVGFVLKKDIDLVLKRGKKGNQMNYEVDYFKLRPITKFIKLVLNRKDFSH